MRLRTNPFLAERSKIRGFVYEVETGRLRQAEGSRQPMESTISS
jgi:hypothetical protein